MVKGDIILYTHDDGREFYGVVRGQYKEHIHQQYLPLCLLLDKVPHWNNTFIAKSNRVELVEAV